MALAREEYDIRTREDYEAYELKKRDAVQERFLLAVMHSDVSATRRLLAANAHQINVNTPIDDQLNFPVHIAFNNGCIELVELLHRFGANINAKDAKGNSLLHLALINNHCQFIDHLFAMKIKKNIRNTASQTAMHLAVELGLVYPLSQMINNRLDINVHDWRGRTPLHLAVRRGDEHIFGMLLDAGANVRLSDKEGNTVLHYAVALHKVNMARFLSKDSALYAQKNLSGNKAFEFASSVPMKKLFYSLDTL